MDETTLVFNCSKINSYHKMYSIGVLLISDGQILDEFDSHYEDRSSYNQETHENWLRNVWLEMEPIFKRADNYTCLQASSHQAILEQSLNGIGIDLPEIDFLNLTTLLKRRLPDESHTREDLIKKYNIEAHYGLNRDLKNAFVSFRILENLIKIKEPFLVSEIIKEIELDNQINDGNFWRRKADSPVIIESTVNIDKLNGDYFLGKTFLATGIFQEYPDRKKLESLIEELGGIKMGSVGKKLNILIAGSDAGPSKLLKAKELKDSGVLIDIINEDSLLKFLKN